MRVVKQLAVLAAISAVAYGGYYGWQHYSGVNADKPAAAAGKKSAVTVETATAALRDLDVLVEAVGSTRALRTVEITPFAAGRVTGVGFTAGQMVEAGDVLLRLDDEIQRADVIEAEALLTEAVATLKRSQTLKKSNNVADATIDSLVAKVAIAQADRDRAHRRLKDRVVTAPFGGVVGFSSVELGARVEEGQVVTVLDDLSLVEVEFSLSERLFGKIGLDRPVIANAAPFPDRVFNGTIRSLDSRVDPVSRSFKVRAVVDNSERDLPAGMFVHLSVVLDAEKVLAVPEEAIIVDGSRAFVFAVVKKDETLVAERRVITIGRRSFGFVELTEGVAPGDLVIIRGVQKVRDGSLVQTRNTSAPKKKPEPADGQVGS
ncbi:MAG: efflux RND transporter periplasmic adaptor subunit [Rhodospirillales bacterium]